MTLIEEFGSVPALTSKRSSLSRYETLDGLRGVGALWVMFLHFAPDMGVSSPTHGYLAVDLFFCLSGFVLTKSYASRIEEGMSFSEWMAVRLIRLYPLYFLSIAAGALATLIVGMVGNQLQGANLLMAIVSAFLMLPSPTWGVMPEQFPLNFVAWSLFIEIVLSGLFFWTSRYSTKTLWCILAAGFIGLVLCRIYLGYIGGGWAWRDGPTGAARGLYGFTAGMLIARQKGVPRKQSWLAWLPLAAAAILMSMKPPHPVAYDLAVIFFAMPSITFFAVRVELLNAAALRLLGDLSYPVYTFQSVTFFGLETLGWIRPNPKDLPTMAKGMGTFAIFLLCCWVLNRYYDTPVRKYLSARLRARRW